MTLNINRQSGEKLLTQKPGDEIAVAAMDLLFFGTMPQSGENHNGNGKQKNCSHNIESGHSLNHNNLTLLINNNPPNQKQTASANPDNIKSGLNSMIKNGITIDAKNTCPISANISETNFNWDWDNIIINFNNNNSESDVNGNSQPQCS